MYDTMITLAEQLYISTKVLLVQKGLKANSDLVRSIEVRADQNLIRMLSNDYMEYVSTGRKAGGRKVPISAILEFIKQNSIRGKGNMTENQLAFAIQTSIWKRGIIGKNFTAELLKLWNEMSEKKITTDVEKKMLGMLDNAKIN